MELVGGEAVNDQPAIHPAADLFPMLGEEELTALQNNILAHGQNEPITTWKGVVVDGRNRLEACRRIGKKPKTKERAFADESEVIAFIISANLRRRHLTTSQRAMIADELAKLERGSNQHGSKVDASIEASTAQAAAAKSLDVSRASVQRARAVSKADPVLAQKVKAGEVTLNAAHKQIAPPKPKPKPEPKTEPAPVIDDPDFAASEDPPPYIPPAPKKDLYIGPAEGEDIDAWEETQPDDDEDGCPLSKWEESDKRQEMEAFVDSLLKMIDDKGYCLGYDPEMGVYMTFDGEPDGISGWPYRHVTVFTTN
jgi:hypothetical protein